MAKASTRIMQDKLTNAIENAIAHGEISIEQYELAMEQVKAMDDNTALINCDNETYLFILGK